MNKNLAEQLISMTLEFYKLVGKEFDETRKSYWIGWEKILNVIFENLKDSKKISIADIGCGNGRFADYLLEENKLNNFTYKGFDSNDYLLNIAKEKFNEKDINFFHTDCINNLVSIKEQFDVVVAFGITHHIPDSEFRKKWFAELADKVLPKGFLIFSNWQINLIDNFQEKLLESDYELESGDYILGWNNSLAKRYVHIYSAEEMEQIQSLLKSLDFKLVESFENDGRNSKLNKYFIFQNVYS